MLTGLSQFYNKFIAEPVYSKKIPDITENEGKVRCVNERKRRPLPETKAVMTKQGIVFINQ